MEKLLITESAILELVKEALDAKLPYDAALIMQDEELPVVTNPSVDSSLVAVEVSPVDVQFVPRDKTEFELAIKSMTKNLPDDVIPMLYAKVRETVLDTQEKCDSPEDLGDTEEMIKRDHARLGVHEQLRKAIRSILAEEERPHVRRGLGGQVIDPPEEKDMFDPESWDEEDPSVPFHMDKDDSGPVFDDEEVVDSLEDLDTHDVDDETSSDWDPEPVVQKKKHNRKELASGVGVEGDVYKKIAQKLNMSVAGIKRLETVGLGKLRYLMSLSPDEVKTIVHGAARDWVETLVDKGRLSDAEGMSWLRNLDVVAQDDEFREFLGDYIRKEMKADDEWVYKDKEDKEEPDTEG